MTTQTELNHPAVVPDAPPQSPAEQEREKPKAYRVPFVLKTAEGREAPNVEVSKPQKDFLDCKQPLVLFCGGVGSGKTCAGAMWLRDRALDWPKAVGFVGANTYLQLHKSTLPQLLRLFAEHGPDYVFGTDPRRKWKMFTTRFPKHENVISLKNGAQILAYSLDNYNVIRGLDLAYIWLDETRDTEEEAFQVLLARRRGFQDVCGNLNHPVRITTTPDGFDWLYERFAEPSRRDQNTVLIRSSSYENPFVPEGFADDLARQYSRDLAKQELFGEFINLQKGRAYAFERHRHVGKTQYEPRLPLIFTHDFNRAPLCSVIMQADETAREAWVLEEIRITERGLTSDSAREFRRRWKPRRPRRVLIYGDPNSGRPGTVGANDFSVLLGELKPHFPGVRDCHARSAPEVVERVNAVNNLLDPDQGPPRLKIDPSCAYLIRDLEKVSFKEGTKQLDKGRDKTLTHLSDALGYAITEIFPCQRHRVTGWSEGEGGAI